MATHDDPLVGEVRVRTPLPLVIPLAALAVIALLVYGFSRLLLAEPEAATAVALLTAANVLAAAAFIALRRDLSRTAIVELLIVASYPLLIGAVISQVGLPGDESAEEHGSVAAPAPEGVTTEVVAEGSAFNTTEMRLTAEQEVEVTLINNDDGIPHNISIYETEAADQDLFLGAETNGGPITYDIPPLEAGEYYFQCDFHAGSMNGVVTVE